MSLDPNLKSLRNRRLGRFKRNALQRKLRLAERESKTRTYPDQTGGPSTSDNRAAGFVQGDVWIQRGVDAWILIDDAAGTWAKMT